MDPIDIAIDSSDVMFHKSGGWITHKYGEKRSMLRCSCQTIICGGKNLDMIYRRIVETMFSVFKHILNVEYKIGIVEEIDRICMGSKSIYAIVYNFIHLRFLLYSRIFSIIINYFFI